MHADTDKTAISSHLILPLQTLSSSLVRTIVCLGTGLKVVGKGGGLSIGTVVGTAMESDCSDVRRSTCRILPE